MPELSKDLSELIEVDPSRIDRVKSPASGFPVLLMKSVAAKDVDKKGRLDEAPDISNAEAVLRLLAGLIESEARELESGRWGEICDIEMLTSAAYTMNCFRNREQMSAESDSLCKSLESAISGRATELGVSNPMSDSASKETDVTDTEIPTPTTEPTPDAPIEKSIPEQIAEAIAKEVAPHLETIKGLRDELTALKNRPLPGGPKITGTAVKAASTATNAEAANFERLSKEVNDRELARYYADRAKEAREASE